MATTKNQIKYIRRNTMIKDLILVIRVIKIKRKLKKIEKRIDKINDIMCKSNHTIDQMIELLEEHNDL